MLKNLCGQTSVDELDRRLAAIHRFPGLKVFKHGLENIKRFTADEFRNMMKVFVFVIEGIITKYKKGTTEQKTAKKQDEELVGVYHRWNKMYLFSRKEYFLESELVEFKVFFNFFSFFFLTDN